MSYSAYWKIRKQPFLINWKALGNAHEIMFCFNDIIQKTTIILGGYQSTLIAKPDNYMAGVAAPASLGFPCRTIGVWSLRNLPPHTTIRVKHYYYMLIVTPSFIFVKYYIISQALGKSFFAFAYSCNN